MAEEEAAATGRRDRNKVRTRFRLQRAALELFAAQGYDATTVAQITDAADVSLRTFFRYFDAKDEVLFTCGEGEPPFFQLLRDQPLEVGDIAAVRGALEALLPQSRADEERLLLLKRALVSTPALEGRNLAIQRDFQNRIALTLAQRRGLSQPDDASLVAAAVTQAVMQLAFDRWAASGGHEDLPTHLRTLFDLLAAHRDDCLRTAGCNHDVHPTDQPLAAPLQE
jgi:AcrR family transcriptional regulator